MERWSGRRLAAGLLALALAACSGAGARSDVLAVRPSHTAADVRFVSGMIPHHGQAVVIAGWAPTHAAGERVRVLCERIVVEQRDEIASMQAWLEDHGEAVPGHNATPMMMGGMDDDTMMPGMLSSEELSELDRARGAEFDRLFLTFMIRHHEGALTMVDELFGANGAAQDEAVYKIASDVYADQSIEIERMQRMLDALDERSPA